MAAVLSIIAVILLAGALFFVTQKIPDEPPPPPKPPSTCTGTEVTVEGIKSLQKCQVEDLLRAVENSKPRQFTTTAMCYSVGMEEYAPVSYVCPICGSRTQHDGGTAKRIKENLYDIRKSFYQLYQGSPLKLDLDESSLCSKCSKGTNGPQEKGQYLTIYYADGTIFTKMIDNARELDALRGLLEEREWVRDKNNEAIFIRDKTYDLRKFLDLPKTGEKN